MSKLLFDVAIIVAIITFLQKIRETKLQHITLERRNWRERLRRLLPELLKNCTFSNKEKERLIEKLEIKNGNLVMLFTVKDAFEILLYKDNFDYEFYSFLYKKRRDEEIDDFLREEILEYVFNENIKNIFYEKRLYISSNVEKKLIKIIEIVNSINLLKGNNYLTILNLDSEKKERAIEIVYSLLLSLNPESDKDKYLREEIQNILKYKVINREKFISSFAKLLKNEWEKGKFEASNLKEFILIGIFFLMLSIFNLQNFFEFKDIKLTIAFNIILILGMSFLLYNQEKKYLNKNLIREKKMNYVIMLGTGILLAYNIYKLDKINNNKLEKIYSEKIKEQITKSYISNEKRGKNNIKESLNNNLSGNKIIGNTSQMENSVIDELSINPNFNISTQGEKKEKGNIKKMILFDFDEFILTPSGRKIIDEIVKEKGQKDRIILLGGADTMGTKEYNYLLKKKRLETVKKALINRGVLSENIKIKITLKEFIYTKEQVKEPFNKAVKIIVEKNN